MPSATAAQPNSDTGHPTLSKLAAEITANAAIINDYLSAHDLPQPSFDRDGPATFPVPETEAEVHHARIGLLEASKAIYDLALGPISMLSWSALTYKYECATLRAINHFNIAAAVPLDGEASFRAISRATGLSEDFVSRIIRFATTSRVFHEHRPGFVVHTAASRVLATDPNVQGSIAHNLGDVFPATAKLDEAAVRFMRARAPSKDGAENGGEENGGEKGKVKEKEKEKEKDGEEEAGEKEGEKVEMRRGEEQEEEEDGEGEPNQTAFNLAFGTQDTFWDYLARNDDVKEKFHRAMKAGSRNPTSSATYILQAVDWGSISDGLVVDIGGSHGHVSMTLARQYPNLRFTVQDLPDVVQRGREALPSDMGGRIAFMAHDMLRPQPVVADVYLLRWILHDWSDKYCARILANVVRAMKQGARIVVMDVVLPPPNTVPKVQEKLQRSGDLQMMTMLNARERTLEDWERLFARVDRRLRIVNVTSPTDSALSVLEVVFGSE